MGYQRIYAKIDLGAIEKNVAGVRSRIPAETKIMAVIKADGYGHGAVTLARFLERQVDWGIVSLFPQDGAAEGVTLTGLQYPLTDARLTPDVGLAVSNHFLAEQAVITVRKGALLVGWQLPPL